MAHVNASEALYALRHQGWHPLDDLPEWAVAEGLWVIQEEHSCGLECCGVYRYILRDATGGEVDAVSGDEIVRRTWGRARMSG